MSPDERKEVARSVANLWTFNTSFLIQLMLALRQGGALSADAAERVLQRMDADTSAIEGEDDQQHATQALAVVRSLLAENGLGPSGSGGSKPRRERD